MSVISSWLLSIAGIVLLSVLTEFILPDGQINKFIKVVFSFVILFVVILPLPNLLGKTFNLEKYFGSQTLQQEYLEQVNLDQLNVLSEEVNRQVSASGLKNVSIAIGGNIFGEKLEIFKISVDFREIEYDDTFNNKDIESAKAVVLEIIDKHSILKNVEVKFYE